MITPFNLSVISILYLFLLFAIAYYGDKFASPFLKRHKAIIVALCLPIFFTAWSFYGTPAQMIEKGWFIPPTTVGAVLAITFAIPFVKRLIKLGKQNRSTSIAGFISSQYENSKLVALLITSVIILGMLPYLSLQLKAISTSFDLFSTDLHIQSISQSKKLLWQDTTFAATLLMAIFSIVFGTRHVDLTEHHNGLMLVVAFESIVKFISVCAVGYYVGYQIFDSPSQMLMQALNNEDIQKVIALETSSDYGTAILLGMAAVVCLPWLFHLLVVETNSQDDADTTQWVFPLYAIIFSFLLLIIIITGILYFQNKQINSEMFFLAIPITENRTGLALLAYIGGLSAATSMIIVATITLSTMVCNDMIVPLLLRQKNFYLQASGVGNSLLKIRRWAIVFILFFAYLFYRLIGSSGNLGAMGLMSITLIVQLIPTLIAALYWKNRHKNGVVAGITIGTLLWGYCLLTPALVKAGWLSIGLLTSGPWAIHWLRPQALFSLEYFDPLTNGVFWSLTLNCLVFILVSKYFSKRSLTSLKEEQPLTNASLLYVTSRFLGEEQAKLALLQHCTQHRQEFLPDKISSPEIAKYTESLLAGIIGPSSAKHILDITRQQEPSTVANTEQLLQEASDVLKFSRELLQTSIDNMSQGITVVDHAHRLVAWNKRCIELFNYPENLFYVGSPIQDLIRYNAAKEKLDEVAINQRIEDQLESFSKQEPYIYQRNLSNNQVIEIRGEPIPKNGYVITYTDISKYQQMVNALQESNENLEGRVAQRTSELTQINHRLGMAKSQAEAANLSKTRFLAAASHDLAQPLNAARLFTTALQHLQLAQDPIELIDHLSDSLQNAESLIKELFDIAKIDAGVVKKSLSHFPIQQVLSSLSKDFTVLIHEKNLAFNSHPCSLIVLSDSKLLRRIIQNLLANALRYTNKGRIVLGCRHLNNSISIEVWDTGIGIPNKDIKDIFVEFKRLNHRGHEDGAGLGLATVHRLCLLLDLPIEVKSVVGKGSVFKITVPLGQSSEVEQPQLQQKGAIKIQQHAKSLSVLCIDNDEKILIGMQVLLNKWQHKVICANSYDDASDKLMNKSYPDIILADYHLDKGETGISVVQQLFSDWNKQIPCVIISADPAETVKSCCKDLDFLFLQKPIKPHVLRAALSRVATKIKYN